MSKYNKYIRTSVSATAMVSALSLPFVSFAQNSVNNLKELIAVLIQYFNVAILLIASLAVIVFIWNVYKYFIYDVESSKKEAGIYLLYSLIGFFVMLSLWGLVNIVKNTFILDDDVPGSIPFGGGFGGSSSFRSGSGVRYDNAVFDSSNDGSSSNNSSYSDSAGLRLDLDSNK